MPPEKTTNCPCCSGEFYANCCEPFITGAQQPKTPEQLMRSRYTAYTQCNIDYIFNTMRDDALKKANREDAARWAKRIVWKSLEIVEASDVDKNSTEATVEFAAHYEENDKPKTMREKSVFKKYDGAWYYVSSMEATPPPIVQRVVGDKVGRNDPCPCGSGKKYKKCCMTA